MSRLIDADELVERCKRVIAFGIADKRGNHPIAAEAVIGVINEIETWIPTSLRLPDKDGDYLVTFKMLSIYPIEVCRFHNGAWDSAPYDEVVAWMPLPEPYKGVTT